MKTKIPKAVVLIHNGREAGSTSYILMVRKQHYDERVIEWPHRLEYGRLEKFEETIVKSSAELMEQFGEEFVAFGSNDLISFCGASDLSLIMDTAHELGYPIISKYAKKRCSS